MWMTLTEQPFVELHKYKKEYPTMDKLLTKVNGRTTLFLLKSKGFTKY